MYRILVGEMAASGEIYDLAFGMMLQGAQSAQDPVLYERAAQIAMQARSGASALQALTAWQKNFPSSIEAAQQKLGLELLLQKTGDASETLSGLAKLLSPDQLIELGGTLPRLLERVQKPQERAPLVRRAIGPLVKDPIRGASAYAILGATALQVGDKSEALRDATSALQKSPTNRLALTLAVALLDTGEWALQPQIERYLSAADADLRIRYYYARALAQMHQNKRALEVLEVAQGNPNLDLTSLLLMATLNAEQKNWARAKAQAQKAVEQVTAIQEPDPPTLRDRNTAILLLAEIAQKEKKWAEAEQWLAQADGDADPLNLAFRKSSILASQGRLDEAKRLLAGQPADDPRAQRRLMWMRVQLLKDHDAWDQAYELLAQASQRYPGEADWIYTQGMVAERLGRYADMERLMRRHMELEPEDHQARNALGYSLADRGIRLDEAKSLIQAALTIVPNDPFVLDSWGWVLFRSGDLVQAEKVLMQAWLSRADAEIAAHLGEVQWALGRRDQARETWRQGLALDAENATLRSTLARFDSLR